jgi:hypothetical protein
MNNQMMNPPNMVDNLIQQDNPTNLDIDKEKIKTYVQDYLNLDKEIVTLKDAIKERNKQKKKLSDKILIFMKHFNIDDMNFSYGKLSFKTGQRKKAMKKSGLLDTYSEFFDGDTDKAEKLMEFIDSKKQTETVENLKKSLMPINSFKLD